MSNQTYRDQAVSALAPFINYFHSVGFFRKIGLYILVMTGNFRPLHLRHVIQQPGSVYHFIGTVDGSHLRTLIKSVLITVGVLWFIDAIFVTNILNFIILAVLLGTTCLVSVLAYAFIVARAGFLFQIRIPEHYKELRSLILNNQQQMLHSNHNMIRYAPVAFHSMTRDNLDAFRFLGILEGVLQHMELTSEDFADQAEIENNFESDVLSNEEVSHG